jgi:uncharacterized Zn-binding protein involved in type VI secretion
MAKNSVARVGKDIAAGSLLVSGSVNVITNDAKTAFVTSANVKGKTVVAGNSKVIVNDKAIARESDPMSGGGNVQSGSTKVFA